VPAGRSCRRDARTGWVRVLTLGPCPTEWRPATVAAMALPRAFLAALMVARWRLERGVPVRRVLAEFRPASSRTQALVLRQQLRNEIATRLGRPAPGAGLRGAGRWRALAARPSRTRTAGSWFVPWRDRSVRSFPALATRGSRAPAIGPRRVVAVRPPHAPSVRPPSAQALPRRGVAPLGIVLVVVLVSGVALAIAYALYLRSDAYRHGNRLFYRDGRPNRAGRAFGRFWAIVGTAGLGPSYVATLETLGHRSGEWRAIPVVLADHGGERYVVSMLGERSPWVRNVRAADGRAFLRHGRRQEVRLVEVPPEGRAPIIKAYLGRALGGRPHIPVDPDAPVEAFESIAEAYPVFRVGSLTADR